MKKIFILAGEDSGDALGGRLMQALQARRDDLTFFGVGGPRMEAAGLRSQFPIRELSVMGLAEVLPRLIPLRRRLHETIAAILADRPDVVVTIDSPGFALRVLKGIAPLGVPRIHYVAPQVWAWRQDRVKAFPGLWDELLCLLPFEPDFFAPYDLHPRFVGHPVLESGADRGVAARFFSAHRILPNAAVVVIMPGSRVTETSRLMPIFRETMARLALDIPHLVPVLAAAPGVADAAAAMTADWPTEPIVARGEAERYDAFAAARAALTKSGTSTLELAMAGVPMAVTYRVNPISGGIARRVIKVKHVALINLLAGRELVPELLQQDCQPEKLAAVLKTLLTDDAQARAQREGFKPALETLNIPGTSPSEAAAEAILNHLD
jgi:lipid-A-disaccharide synthase